ncbi:MAG: FAD-dependent oxidoreductase [Acidobacteria bacterium]|nr:FAD-dependent oxidoreductase [Acidobacteriota bacterium]
MSDSKRVLIVGGVAGGASCAARLRRLDESAGIVVFERGPYVSFATCGLPYYIGDVIRDEAKLLVATPELFRARFNIEVRTQSEVVRIDRAEREIEVRDLGSGRAYRESYDALVLAPGAAPIRPPLLGIELPGVFTLRTIPDSRRIRDWMLEKQARRAVVAGGGFIGLEMAENLAHRGLEVTIVEMADQLLPPLDPEMAELVRQHLVAQRVGVELGGAVAAFEQTGEDLAVRTGNGRALPADIVILALGVRPESELARAAGLDLGARGGIRVDEQMRTSDPRIWAVGDAVETRDFVTGEWGIVPLAGPANRQGRIAADSIRGRPRNFRGVQATAVCGVFGLTVAMTGASEKTLRRIGWTGYQAVYVHPGHRAAYYPGAQPIHLKLIFRASDGRILGAQAVGEEGVERRIDVIAMAIQKQGTVFDLEEAELCYAPQYGAAKDPVNMAGMAAANVARGDADLARWDDLPDTGALLVDVRDPAEYARDHIDGALNIPLDQLRDRLNELPRDREIWVNCAAGQRSYYAMRILKQRGFRARNLSGGYQTYASSRII